MFAMSFHGANKVAPNCNVMGPVKVALEASYCYLACELGQRIRVHPVPARPLKTRASGGPTDFDLTLNQAAQRAPLVDHVYIMDVGFT